MRPSQGSIISSGSTYRKQSVGTTGSNVTHPHTPHMVKRRKYSAGQLATTSIQCNKPNTGETSNAGNDAHIEIQCEIEPSSSKDAGPICADCKCTGFCNPNCKPKKMSCDEKSCASKAQINRKSSTGQNPKCKCSAQSTNSKRKSKTIFKDSNVGTTPKPSRVCMNNDAPHGYPGTSRVCVECQCTGLCNAQCTVNREKIHSLMTPEDFNRGNTICVNCKCISKCNPLCEKDKMAFAGICDPCDCDGPCTAECEVKKLEKPCEKCVCVGTCNEACTRKKLICDPCDCTNGCFEECEAAKAAQAICEDCFCKATCKPLCEENKSKKTDVCASIPSCMSKQRTSEEKKSVRMASQSSTGSQVQGIIEEFDDQNITENLSASPILPENKTKSACNVAGEVICEECTCDADCNPTCQSSRLVKSACDIPSQNVCEECTCVYSCSPECELVKSKNKKDDKPDSDWVPCSSCKDDEPCSPECRERRAIAHNMPEAPGRTSKEEPKEAKKGVKSCATPVQACPPCCTCDAQTTSCDTNLTRTTSTTNSNIREECICARETKSCGSPPNCCDLENPPCTSPQSAPECSICHKIVALVSSIFTRAEPQTCGDQPNSSKEEESCTCCNCASAMEGFPCSQPPSCPPTPPKPPNCGLNFMTTAEPCQCLRKSSSYGDKMKQLLGQLRTSCDDAESFTSPYIKAASVFNLDVNNQQEAIVALLQKCQEKDSYIDALVHDLLKRSRSRAFCELKMRLQMPSAASPDYDCNLIANALHAEQKVVCGVDLHNFKIISMKRIGATKLLVQWNPPDDPRVNGYEITTNGLTKKTIENKNRAYAVLDALDLSGTIAIEVYSLIDGGRALPSVVGYYAKYQ